MQPGLAGKRIFLTGASGFVGARLAECLARAYGAEIHALVRRPGTPGTARLARLSGVRLFVGDVMDADVVGQAMQGCRLVIHGAVGNSGSRRGRQRVTVTGTRCVFEVAARQGVERVVHLSSASVHDPVRSGPVIREDSPLNGRELAEGKVLTERLVEEYHHTCGLPLTTLRPTCVWGPFSPVWTMAAAALIRRQVPFLPRQGQGICNAVYIDNLVDAVVLALTIPAAAGETFLVNDDEPRTWQRLYGAYAELLGVPLAYGEAPLTPLKLVMRSAVNSLRVLAHAHQRPSPRFKQTLRALYDYVPLANLAVQSLPGSMQAKLGRWAGDATADERSQGSPGHGPDGGLRPYVHLPSATYELYCSSGRYCSDKAKTVLGWQSRVAFDSALARTAAWLTYAGLTGDGSRPGERPR